MYYILFFVYIGLSIFLREKVYRKNETKNFMGTVNAFVFMSELGMLIRSVGLFGFLNYFPLANYLTRGVIVICYIAAGLITVFLRPVRAAFTKNTFLYYSSPVIVGIMSIPSLIMLKYNVYDLLYFKVIRTIPVIVLLLVYIGLSIFLRKNIYHENLQKNFMGTVNSFVFMSVMGLPIGFLIGAFFGNGAPFAYLATGMFVAIIGFIVGAIIGFLRPLRTAFSKNPFLYYSSSVIVGLLSILRIIVIWVKN
ncbi:hypothetical protein FACS189462_0430 [Spirochaetia bacterium]|nr:hypothetical protein FACS189462_0430 [Spirochaetia bacterium]